MNDQRVPFRPSFDPEDRLDRLGIVRVGSQAIDGFRRKGDQSPLAQDLDGRPDRIGLSHPGGL